MRVPQANVGLVTRAIIETSAMTRERVQRETCLPEGTVRATRVRLKVTNVVEQAHNRTIKLSTMATLQHRPLGPHIAVRHGILPPGRDGTKVRPGLIIKAHLETVPAAGRGAEGTVKGSWFSAAEDFATSKTSSKAAVKTPEAERGVLRIKHPPFPSSSSISATRKGRYVQRGRYTDEFTNI